MLLRRFVRAERSCGLGGGELWRVEKLEEEEDVDGIGESGRGRNCDWYLGISEGSL